MICRHEDANLKFQPKATEEKAYILLPKYDSSTTFDY
jgi:hypothetical protein